MIQKDKFKAIYKAISLAFLTGCFLLLPVITFAQGDLPCDDSDPYSGGSCPLDTWVWVLAAVALVFGAAQLYRKQKLQSKI